MTENKRTKPKRTGKRKQTLALKATGLDPEVFNHEWDRLPNSVKGKLASKELADLILRFAELSEALKNSRKTAETRRNNRSITGGRGWLKSFLSGVGKHGENAEAGRNSRKNPVAGPLRNPLRGPFQPLREAFSLFRGLATGGQFLQATEALLKKLARRGRK